MAYNMFDTPQMKKPVGVYDPNQGWRGTPSAQNIADAVQTPTAKLQQLESGGSTTINTTPGGQGSETTGNGRNNTPITSTEDLAAAMSYTTPEQEEKIRKASLMNRRILAVGDALRHIGNIANTVNYAPAQKFNNPVLEEQARYEHGKALRDRANQQYFAYQRQKAAQDRAAAKMEMEFKLKQADDARKDRLNDARISRYNAQNAKDSANQAYWETRARLLEEGTPLDKAIKEANLAKIKEQTRLTSIKANQGGFAPRRSGGGKGGSKYWDYDEEGNIHYYPNKTMWEQGVEEHSQGQNPNETYPSGKKDWRGNPEQKTRKRTTVTKAGKNAYNAHNKNKKQSNGTNNSGFFN